MTPDPLLILPLGRQLDAIVTVPGSKSYTNRALVCAALAEGATVLRGALHSDDTEAMVSCLVELGFVVTVDEQATTITVEGAAGHIPASVATVNARLSGTTARFVLPLAACGVGHYRVDGAAPLRRRPMADLLNALVQLGATIEMASEPGHLPVVVVANGLAGGECRLPGNVSSQFLSGLLLSAPAYRNGLTVTLTTELVSRSYVEMTLATMGAFGANVESARDTFVVSPGAYHGHDHSIEPDASAASYPFAAAAICGGRVRVDGLGRGSLQGDLGFVHLLSAMGCDVTIGDTYTEVVGRLQADGRPALRGIDVNMADCSDVAQTLAVVAAHATSPTRVTGIGFIRGKETDRLAAVVTELQRCGIRAVEEADGFLVHPGDARPAIIQTYDDHRMAMSFALLGLRSPGIRIADPGCVAKTFPRYWDMLAGLRQTAPGAAHTGAPEAGSSS